jgi:hippurate hydrolase
MRKLTVGLVALLFISLNANAQNTSLDAMIQRDLASLLSTYKALHTAPELSHREEKTSAFVAGELRKLGFTVTERIGKFQNSQWNGYGVVGVLRMAPAQRYSFARSSTRCRLKRKRACLIRVT